MKIKKEPLKKINETFYALLLVVVAVFGLGSGNAWGQSLGDFRSKQTGSWGTASTWQIFNGTNWEDGNFTWTDTDLDTPTWTNQGPHYERNTSPNRVAGFGDPGDNWYYTSVELTQGRTYILTYDRRTSSNTNNNHRFRIAIGSSAPADAAWSSATQLENQLHGNTNWQTRTAANTFTPAESGTYYLGFRLIASDGQWTQFGQTVQLIANDSPGSTSSATITIQNGHNVTQGLNYTAGSSNNIIIEDGGTLTYDAGHNFNFSTLVVQNGGTFVRNSTNTHPASVTVENGGVYRHNIDGGTIPTMTWNEGSTLEITGFAGTTGTMPTATGTYQNVVFNWTANSSATMESNFQDIQGDLIIKQTGTSGNRLNFSNSNGETTFNIGGDIIVEGGTLYGTVSAGNNVTLNIEGGINVDGGVFQAYNGSLGSSTGWVRINLTNNNSGNKSSIMKMTTSFAATNRAKWEITIKNGRTITLGSNLKIGTRSNGTNNNSQTLTVEDGAVLNVGTFIVEEQGTISRETCRPRFDLQSGATLITAHASGITSSDATGSIQVTGTRTYSTGANYTYNGTATQVTGNGLPASVNDLSIDNAAGVTLTNAVTVNGALNLTNGNLLVDDKKLTYNGTAFNKNNGQINAASGEIDFVNASSLTLPNNVFDGPIKDLTLSGAGGVKVRENIEVTGVLNLAASNPNDTDGILDMVNDYGDYLTSRYSTNGDGTLSDTRTTASAANDDPVNNLDSYVLTMGANATTIGNGDVTGKITRTSIANNTTYSFGNKNMTLSFTQVDDSDLPETITVVVTRGDKGVHPDKQETDLSFAQNENDTLLGAIHVGRIYQVMRTGGHPATRFSISFPYEDSELNGNSEADLVTWDHHVDVGGYDGATPHEHGKTSNDATENFVTLANHGLFYLVEEAAGSDTKYWMLSNKVTEDIRWLGAVDSSDEWEIPSNWSSGLVPDENTDIVIPNEDFYDTELNLNSGNYEVGTIEIKPNAVVHGGSATLTLKKAPALDGGSGTWINQGNFIPGTSTVFFDATNATYGGTTNFHNVTVASGTDLTLQLGSELRIAGTLATSGILDASSNANTIVYNGTTAQTTAALPTTVYNLTADNSDKLTLDDDITLKGNLVIEEDSELEALDKTLTIEGDFENNADFTKGTSTFIFAGSSDKAIKGTQATTFNNLTMDGSGKLTLEQETTVDGTLTLTNGLVAIEDEDLILDGTLSGGDATSYVSFEGNGLFKHQVNNGGSGSANVSFPVGSNSRYVPATITFSEADGSPSSYLTIRTSNSSPGALNPENTYRVNRTWSIVPENLVNYNYNAILTYSGDEIVGSGDESSLTPVKYSNDEWYKPEGSSFTTGIEQGTASIDIATNTVTWSELTSFSEFTIVGDAANALPVEMVSFSAQCEGERTKLEWVTASEINSKEFQVERSRDGQNWTSVAVIPAAGTSNEYITYNFEEERSGLIYYRLIQVDFDGQYEVFGPISANCAIEKDAIAVYPNPSSGDFVVQVDSKEDLGRTGYSILDASGKLIYQSDAEIAAGRTNIYVSRELENGVYFIRLHHEKGQFNVGKVIVK